MGPALNQKPLPQLSPEAGRPFRQQPQQQQQQPQNLVRQTSFVGLPPIRRSSSFGVSQLMSDVDGASRNMSQMSMNQVQPGQPGQLQFSPSHSPPPQQMPQGQFAPGQFYPQPGVGFQGQGMQSPYMNMGGPYNGQMQQPNGMPGPAYGMPQQAGPGQQFMPANMMPNSNLRFPPQGPGGMWKLEESHLAEPLLSASRHRPSMSTSSNQQANAALDKETGVSSMRAVSPDNGGDNTLASGSQGALQFQPVPQQTGPMPSGGPGQVGNVPARSDTLMNPQQPGPDGANQRISGMWKGIGQKLAANAQNRRNSIGGGRPTGDGVSEASVPASVAPIDQQKRRASSNLFGLRNHQPSPTSGQSSHPPPDQQPPSQEKRRGFFTIGGPSSSTAAQSQGSGSEGPRLSMSSNAPAPDTPTTVTGGGKKRFSSFSNMLHRTGTNANTDNVPEPNQLPDTAHSMQPSMQGQGQGQGQGQMPPFAPQAGPGMNGPLPPAGRQGAPEPLRPMTSNDQRSNSLMRAAPPSTATSEDHRPDRGFRNQTVGGMFTKLMGKGPKGQASSQQQPGRVSMGPPGGPGQFPQQMQGPPGQQQQQFGRPMPQGQAGSQGQFNPQGQFVSQQQGQRQFMPQGAPGMPSQMMQGQMKPGMGMQSPAPGVYGMGHNPQIGPNGQMRPGMQHQPQQFRPTQQPQQSPPLHQQGQFQPQQQQPGLSPGPGQNGAPQDPNQELRTPVSQMSQQISLAAEQNRQGTSASPLSQMQVEPPPQPPQQQPQQPPQQPPQQQPPQAQQPQPVAPSLLGAQNRAASYSSQNTVTPQAPFQRKPVGSGPSPAAAEKARAPTPAAVLTEQASAEPAPVPTPAGTDRTATPHRNSIASSIQQQIPQATAESSPHMRRVSTPSVHQAFQQEQSTPVQNPLGAHPVAANPGLFSPAPPQAPQSVASSTPDARTASPAPSQQQPQPGSMQGGAQRPWDLNRALTASSSLSAQAQGPLPPGQGRPQPQPIMAGGLPPQQQPHHHEKSGLSKFFDRARANTFRGHPSTNGAPAPALASASALVPAPAPAPVAAAAVAAAVPTHPPQQNKPEKEKSGKSLLSAFRKVPKQAEPRGPPPGGPGPQFRQGPPPNMQQGPPGQPRMMPGQPQFQQGQPQFQQGQPMPPGAQMLQRPPTQLGQPQFQQGQPQFQQGQPQYQQGQPQFQQGQQQMLARQQVPMGQGPYMQYQHQRQSPPAATSPPMPQGQFFQRTGPQGASPPPNGPGPWQQQQARPMPQGVSPPGQGPPGQQIPYAQVPIPRGYAPVHGEGQMAPGYMGGYYPPQSQMSQMLAPLPQQFWAQQQRMMSSPGGIMPPNIVQQGQPQGMVYQQPSMPSQQQVPVQQPPARFQQPPDQRLSPPPAGSGPSSPAQTQFMAAAPSPPPPMPEQAVPASVVVQESRPEDRPQTERLITDSAQISNPSQPKLRHPGSPQNYPLPETTFSPVNPAAAQAPNPPLPSPAAPAPSEPTPASNLDTSVPPQRQLSAVSQPSTLATAATPSPQVTPEQASPVPGQMHAPPADVLVHSQVQEPSAAAQQGAEQKREAGQGNIYDATPRQPIVSPAHVVESAPVIESQIVQAPQAPTPAPTPVAKQPDVVSPSGPVANGFYHGQQQQLPSNGMSQSWAPAPVLNGNAQATTATTTPSPPPAKTSAEIFEEQKRLAYLREQEEKIPVNPTEPDMEAAMLAARRRRQQEEDMPHMSATSYPGQEWNPFGDGYIDDLPE